MRQREVTGFEVSHVGVQTHIAAVDRGQVADAGIRARILVRVYWQ